MKVYYIDLGNGEGQLIATHTDDQNVDPSVYGPNVKVFTIDSADSIVRVGTNAVSSSVDMRPIQIPATSASSSPTLADQQTAAIKTIYDAINTASDAITAAYPPSEQLSWTAKEVAAQIYLANGQLSTIQNTLLQSELSASGTTDLTSLCNSIISRAELLAKITGAFAGLRWSSTAAINAATTADAISKIVTDTAAKIKVIVDSAATTTVTTESSDGTASTPTTTSTNSTSTSTSS